MFEGRLAKLRCHLRCGIVHELSVRAEYVPARAALLLVRTATVALLRLRLRHGRRGRAQLGNRRDMLGYGVVQGGRLPVCLWTLHDVQMSSWFCVLFVSIVRWGCREDWEAMLESTAAWMLGCLPSRFSESTSSLAGRDGAGTERCLLPSMAHTGQMSRAGSGGLKGLSSEFFLASSARALSRAFLSRLKA